MPVCALINGLLANITLQLVCFMEIYYLIAIKCIKRAVVVFLPIVS